ncbi:MAG: hypothetical protein ABIG11_06285 [bacterium]
MEKPGIFLAVAVLCSGCVSMSKYKAQKAELSATQAVLAAVRNEAAAFAEESSQTGQELIAKNADCVSRLDSAQKSNKDLKEALEAKKGKLSKKIYELIKERDALKQELSEAAVRTGELIRVKDGELAGAKEKEKELMAEIERLRREADASTRAPKK